MITFLIYTLYKKYNKQRWAKLRFSGTKFLSVFVIVVFLSLVVLLLSLIPIKSKAQKLPLHYTIKKGSDDIGWLRIENKVEGNKSVMKLDSEIKMRIVFLMTLSAKESAIFENGKMIYSSQYRKTNGSTKLDKQTRLVGEKYVVLENGGKEDLIIPFIGTNLLCMHFQEPLGIAAVYCDNHQTLIPIQKMGDGGYKVKFPGGNTNCFHYSGGICTKIEISTTFYTVNIFLNAKND